MSSNNFLRRCTWITTFLSLFLVLGLWSAATTKSGWLIMLDGTSSAGKTSVSRHLKSKLLQQAGLSFAYESMDDFNDRKAAEEDKKAAEEKKAQEAAKKNASAQSSTTEHSNESTEPDNTDNAEIRSSTSSKSKASSGGSSDDDDEDSLEDYFHFLNELTAQGKNVIADAVMRDEQDMKDYQSIIGKGEKIVCVLVYCPAAEITRRVQARNISGNKDEERTLYQAIAQIPDMFTITRKPTKQTIDSITQKDVEVMLKPLKKELEEDNKKKRKEGKKEDNIPQTLQALRSSLIPKKGKYAYLQSKMPHDVVAINSRRHGPAVAAQKITNYVLMRMHKGKSLGMTN